MENNKKIETIFSKIFERSKNQSLGLYGMTAKLGYETEDNKIIFMKEVKQQIASCRGSMTNIFGQEIISEIDSLNIKVRKIKRLSIYRKEFEMAQGI
jgi:hypothetical protein